MTDINYLQLCVIENMILDYLAENGIAINDDELEDALTRVFCIES